MNSLVAKGHQWTISSDHRMVVGTRRSRGTGREWSCLQTRFTTAISTAIGVRSRPVAVGRDNSASAILGLRTPKTDRRRILGYGSEPHTGELISPWSQVRIPPPPHFPHQDAKSGRLSGCVRAPRPVRASTGAATTRRPAHGCASSRYRSGTASWTHPSTTRFRLQATVGRVPTGGEARQTRGRL